MFFTFQFGMRRIRYMPDTHICCQIWIIFEVNKTRETSRPKLYRRKQLKVFVTDFISIDGHTFPHPVLMLLTSHSTY